MFNEDEESGPETSRAIEDGITIPSSTHGRVWVVGGSRVQRELCQSVLATHFDVTVHASGSAMVAKLASIRAPHVILLDGRVSDESGPQLCQLIRQRFDRKHVPILVLTASVTDPGLLDALAEGANDFVKKPLSRVELLARVSGQVQLSKLHARVLECERQQREEAELRDRFTGAWAHDLRQPLNTIYLASQSLSLPAGAPGSVPGALDMQMRAVERMKRMIDEFLDFMRGARATDPRPNAGGAAAPEEMSTRG
jgi:PleD family two-component response regulator